MQREFPFLALIPKPKDAKPSLVARCMAQGNPVAMAVSVSLQGMKAAYVAAKLGISAPYLSEIRRGKKPAPEWMPEPFAYLVGSALILQVIADMQRDALDHETPEDVARRLARELRAA